MHTTPAIALVLSALLAGGKSHAGQPARGRAAEDIRIDSALVIRPAIRGGRSPVLTDPIEHLLVTGAWAAPEEGQSLGEGEHATWRRITADENGLLAHAALAGGYAWATIDAPEERVALLHARGHRHVYVNGEPRAGDVYDAGYARLPILLRHGTNEFLFRGGRGRLRASITAPPAPVFVETRDPTLPDVLVGGDEPLIAGIIITNATPAEARNFAVRAVIDGHETRTSLPVIAPLTIRKVPVTITLSPRHSAGEVDLDIELLDGYTVLHSARFTLNVREPSAMHRRTFTSDIDGSVQYYAVTPMSSATGTGDTRPALILTLHGASVEATNQAAAYAPKDWAHVVAPTNRRPFGFDWEDWGRLDAIEVLGLASHALNTDPNRTYVTGHSMGGHGTWHLGVHYPDIFAAIAPSAGWPDFWSYTGAREWPEGDAIERMLHRSMNASSTRELVRNVQHGGVYILHGDEDDNLPVSQARMMRERLGEFHANFAYYERPGAGHWWGSECVDWPPLLAFLQQNTRPVDAARKQVDFLTASPGISSRFAWVKVHQQSRPLEISRVQATVNVKDGRIDATTTNISQLAFDVRAAAMIESRPVTIHIDEQVVEATCPADGLLRLGRVNAGENEGATWRQIESLDPAHKSPTRAGTFKDAFRNRFILIYGTAGSPEENAWALARARFDAETFWYRGNGAPEIIPDSAFDREPDPDRNIILYGNAETNRAWPVLLQNSPVEVRRGGIRIGGRTVAGDDLACIFIRPRPGSDTASIGIVSGTGAAGMRLTNQLPYLISGVAYPDWTIIGADMLKTGKVRGAGFFAPDWSLGSDHAWADDGNK